MPYLLEQSVDGVFVLHIHGNLTGADLCQLEARFEAIVQEKRLRAVIDLSGVVAVSTPGITVMLRTALAVQGAGGRIVFANTQPEVMQTFTWCRLDRILKFVSGDVEGIVQRFGDAE
jgi:anti-anti-sigma factor